MVPFLPWFEHAANRLSLNEIYDGRMPKHNAVWWAFATGTRVLLANRTVQLSLLD